MTLGETLEDAGLEAPGVKSACFLELLAPEIRDADAGRLSRLFSKIDYSAIFSNQPVVELDKGVDARKLLPQFEAAVGSFERLGMGSGRSDDSEYEDSFTEVVSVSTGLEPEVDRFISTYAVQGPRITDWSRSPDFTRGYAMQLAHDGGYIDFIFCPPDRTTAKEIHAKAVELAREGKTGREIHCVMLDLCRRRGMPTISEFAANRLSCSSTL